MSEEIRLFRTRHPDRPVVPLIIEGAPGARELECFPDALRFQVAADGTLTATPDEVLAADVRDEADGQDLAVAKVVARLLDLPTDEVFRRAERTRRSRLVKWVAGFALISVAMAGLAYFADLQRRTVQKRETALIEDQKAMVDLLARSMAERVAGAADLVATLRPETNPVRRPPALNYMIGNAYLVSSLIDSTIPVAKFLIDGRTDMGTLLPSLSVGSKHDDFGPDTTFGAIAHAKTAMGDLLRGIGKLADAREEYAQGLAIRERVFAANPTSAEAKRLLAIAYARLGLIDAMEGRSEGARASFGQAQALLEAVRPTSERKDDVDVELRFVSRQLADLTAGEPKPQQ